MKTIPILTIIALGLLLFAAPGCGGGNEADKLGIGAACTGSCPDVDNMQITCLTNFKGGYCGLTGCSGNASCPSGAICVTHTDNNNYCFRACNTKSECNVNRTTANEANCSSNITRVDGGNTKACVPPSA